MNFIESLLDEKTASQWADQGSDEWEKIRLGRFTASEMFRLMECGKRPMTPEELKARPKSGKGSQTTLVPDPSKMGPKGIKYIREKVWEALTGKQVWQSYAYPLVYGKEQEPFAVECFEQRTGLKCDTTGFHAYTDHAGGTPDRLIGDKEGLEVKCPSSEEQVNYLMLNDLWDLKGEYPNHYWQCVSLLVFTTRDKWHFCTFDPRMMQEKHQLSHIEIPADKVEEDMDAVGKAIEGAVTEKLKLLQLLG